MTALHRYKVSVRSPSSSILLFTKTIVIVPSGHRQSDAGAENLKRPTPNMGGDSLAPRALSGRQASDICGDVLVIAVEDGRRRAAADERLHGLYTCADFL